MPARFSRPPCRHNCIVSETEILCQVSNPLKVVTNPLHYCTATREGCWKAPACDGVGNLSEVPWHANNPNNPFAPRHWNSLRGWHSFKRRAVRYKPFQCWSWCLGPGRMQCMGTNSPVKRTPLLPVGSHQGRMLKVAAAPLAACGGGALKRESSVALCAVKPGLPPGMCLRYRGSWGYVPLMYFEVRADLFIAKQTFTSMLAYPALALGGYKRAFIRDAQWWGTEAPVHSAERRTNTLLRAGS